MGDHDFNLKDGRSVSVRFYTMWGDPRYEVYVEGDFQFSDHYGGIPNFVLEGEIEKRCTCSE